MRPLTFSNVVSVIALFAALGLGTAFALSKNSVGSKQLRPRAVKNSDMANNAVTARNVANGSLLAEDFAPGQLPPGPQGEPGPQGLPGTGGPVISAESNASTNLPTAATVVLTSSPVSAGGAGTYAAIATGLLERNTGGGAPECWLTLNGSTTVTHPIAGARIEDVSGDQATIAIVRTLALAGGDTLSLVCDPNGVANAVAIDEKSIFAFRTS